MGLNRLSISEWVASHKLLLGIVALIVIAGVVVLIVVLTSGDKSNCAITVQNEDETKLYGAIVQLHTSEGLIASARTNAGGVARFTAPPGAYTMRVTSTTGLTDPAVYVPYVGDVVVAAPPEDDETAVTLVGTVTLAGFSSLTPWPTIVTALDTVRDGFDTTVTVTYSFIPPGVYTTELTNHESVTIQDYQDEDAVDGIGHVNTEVFRQQIRDAFGQWKTVFETVYSVASGFPAQLTLNFTETSDNGSMTVFDVYNRGEGGTGDFRIGMWEQGGSPSGMVLAYAYGPNHAPAMRAGDILFNSSVDWRIDADVTDGLHNNACNGYSIMYVAAHEIGHSLGFGHHTSSLSIMSPMAGECHQFSTWFRNGLASEVHTATMVRGVYGWTDS